MERYRHVEKNQQLSQCLHVVKKKKKKILKPPKTDLLSYTLLCRVKYSLGGSTVLYAETNSKLKKHYINVLILYVYIYIYN